MKECPISRSEFREAAEELVLVVNDKPVPLNPKEFSTGSFGWNATTRMTIPVAGVDLVVQVSTNATVLKSKEAPEEFTSEEKQKKVASSIPVTYEGTTEVVPNMPLYTLLPVKEMLFFPDTAGNENFAKILQFLNAAVKSLDVCVFAFTDKRLYSSLLAAHKRGVQVRVIVDDQMTKMKSSKAFALHEDGVPVKMDATRFHMHHKFAIIDQSVVMFGSFNWTVQAQTSNRENLHITSDKEVVTPFLGEFQTLWDDYSAHPKKNKA